MGALQDSAEDAPSVHQSQDFELSLIQATAFLLSPPCQYLLKPLAI